MWSLTLEEFQKEYSNEYLIQNSTPLSGPEAPYPAPLATVLRAQLTHLDNVPDLRWALGMLSCLDHSGIKEQYLKEAVQQNIDPRWKPLGDIRQLQELCEKRLIYRNKDSAIERAKTVWMHQLIQDYCLMDMRSRGVCQEVFSCAFELIRSVWRVPERHNRHNSKLWASQQDLIQHIEALAKRYALWKKRGGERQADSTTRPMPLAFAELCYNGAWYLYERANFSSACSLLEIAEEYCAAHPYDADLILADIYGAYGSIFSESNDPEGCHKNFKKQLEYLKRAITKGLEKSPCIREALAYGGLANAIMGLNNYGDAEAMYSECFRAWDDCPGKGNPDIYIPHLAVCLTLQDKTDKAERILREMIQKREEKYGKKDTANLRTGIAYFALGNTQIRQKKLDQAYETHKDALQMLGVTLGQTHHRYADACYKMGWHLRRQSNYHESIAFLDKALTIYQTDTTIYCNEKARTNYLMGVVYAQLADHQDATGDAVGSKISREKSEEHRDHAISLRRMITPKTGRRAGEEDWSERGYDELIMFWSR